MPAPASTTAIAVSQSRGVTVNAAPGRFGTCRRDVDGVVANLFESPAGPASLLALLVGFMLLGIACLRSRALPVWASVGVLVGVLLSAVPVCGEIAFGLLYVTIGWATRLPIGKRNSAPTSSEVGRGRPAVVEPAPGRAS